MPEHYGMPQPEAAEVGGSFSRSPRGHTPVRESGLTALKEQRMIKRAIREGWLKGQRWATDSTPSELKARQAENGELTLKEQLVAAVYTDASLAIDAPMPADPGAAAALQLGYRKLRQLAVRNGIAMEAQNQSDTLAEDRLNLDRDTAVTVSASSIEAIIAKCVDAVAALAGDEQAESVRAILAAEVSVSNGPRGTFLTPEQAAMAMDSTIGRPPIEACE